MYLIIEFPQGVKYCSRPWRHCFSSSPELPHSQAQCEPANILPTQRKFVLLVEFVPASRAGGRKQDDGMTVLSGWLVSGLGWKSLTCKHSLLHRVVMKMSRHSLGTAGCQFCMKTQPVCSGSHPMPTPYCCQA